MSFFIEVNKSNDKEEWGSPSKLYQIAGIICPVVIYAPNNATIPIIAKRPLSCSASIAKMFCLPYSVVT